MAKAVPVPDVDRETDPQEWFAAVLRLRFNEVFEHREAALEADSIKGVHDMRVAIRRLRSLIRDLKAIFDAHPFKRIQKTLKNLADALGDVRDQDVYIHTLEKLGADGPGPAITERIEYARKTREKAFRKLTRTLSDKMAGRLTKDFSSAVDTVLGEPRLFRPSSVETAASEILSARITEVEKLGNAVYDPFDTTGLHETRIAAKRLRYAGEILSALFSKELEEFVRETKDLQSHLGDVHDCDLWIEDLSDDLKEPKRRGGHAKSINSEGLADLLSIFVRKRAKRYAVAVEIWSKWQQTQRFEQIGKIIGSKD
jgi:CHAD domain-containing protein